jgi:hypothetical protein
MSAAIKEIVELLRSDASLMHALLFNPDALAAKLKSREAKALVYGIDPAAFVNALTQTVVGAGCGDTCGADSCGYTCGRRSCDNNTCSSSCGDTCRHSCIDTTKVIDRFQEIGRPI